jgi:glycolate oxidase
MTASWIGELQTHLDPCPVVTDPEILAAFSQDQAPLAPVGTPLALVRVRTVQDVVTTLRFANEHRIPVVTRAAGTGLAGGANAIDGCILLSVVGLNRIVRIDVPMRIAVVEPGVINKKLVEEVAALGLHYAPDPASRDISTIGGNIATNAGGACCLKYGVTGDHVAALQVVLADGTLIRTGSVTTKNVAGLDLTRLLVGSEGTLGVIVEATVRLQPTPRASSTLAAFFESLQDAAQAIVAMEAASELSLIELMDQTTLKAVEQLAPMDLDTSAAAMVLVQSDGIDAPESMSRCEEICKKHRAKDVFRTDDPSEGQWLLAARKKALPALENLGTTLLDDVAVPKPAIPEMVRRIQAIAARHELVIGTFGHAGDGNLHPTIVFDAQRESSKMAALAAFDEIVRTAMELGGTITGEHGVGSLKPKFLTEMLGEQERALMHRIKQAFDPKGILNPGKGM